MTRYAPTPAQRRTTRNSCPASGRGSSRAGSGGAPVVPFCDTQ